MAFSMIAAVLVAILSLYLWHLNRAITEPHPDALKLTPTRWTKEQIREAYKKAQESPIDVKPFIPPKKGRRYIVVGGSGFVGGWIVQHLLWRGEDPNAIRILDLRVSTRPEVVENNIQFFSTDVADPASVAQGFNAKWKKGCEKLPLTVIHTVAYINPDDRRSIFMEKFAQVNISGTKNVLEAAKAAGATCFICTSSGSIALAPPKLFVRPWQRWPTDYLQIISNAEPRNYDHSPEEFGTCYAYSKAQAERIVLKADDKQNGFRTGTIRPGHSIYGPGVELTSSVSWDYLRRGGAPTWLYKIVTQFVNAQNVSIAHLALEDRLLNPPPGAPDVGGRGYCCTDPNPPITHGDLFLLLMTLAHPLTPMKFPIIPAAPMLLLAQVIESYHVVRHLYLPFLPRIPGDLGRVMPALLNLCCANFIYDDSLAKKEIGYNPPLQTLEGLCLHLVEWNEKVERDAQAKIRKGEGGTVDVEDTSITPVPPVKM